MARKVNPPKIAAQTINRSNCIGALRCAVQRGKQKAGQIWLTKCYRGMPADCAYRQRCVGCPLCGQKRTRVANSTSIRSSRQHAQAGLARGGAGRFRSLELADALITSSNL